MGSEESTRVASERHPTRHPSRPLEALTQIKTVTTLELGAIPETPNLRWVRRRQVFDRSSYTRPPLRWGSGT